MCRTLGLASAAAAVRKHVLKLDVLDTKLGIVS